MCCWTCRRTLTVSHMKHKRCGPTSSLTLKMFWYVCETSEKKYYPGGIQRNTGGSHSNSSYRLFMLSAEIDQNSRCGQMQTLTTSLLVSFNVVQLQVLRRFQHFNSNKFLLHEQIRITQVLNIIKKKQPEFSELVQWSTKGMCATLSALQHHLWSLHISFRSLPPHKVPALHVACLVYSTSIAPPPTSHFIRCYK